MRLHRIAHQEVPRLIMALLPMPNLIPVPLDDKLRLKSLKGVIVFFVVDLLWSDLSNGQQRASHRMLAEGNCLIGMAGVVGRIADVANIRMNVAVRAFIMEARVNASLFHGGERRKRRLLTAMPQADKNAHNSKKFAHNS